MRVYSYMFTFVAGYRKSILGPFFHWFLSGPAGPHDVKVIVHNNGLASGDFTFSYEFSVSSLSPASGSTAGRSISVPRLLPWHSG